MTAQARTACRNMAKEGQKVRRGGQAKASPCAVRPPSTQPEMDFPAHQVGGRGQDGGVSGRVVRYLPPRPLKSPRDSRPGEPPGPVVVPNVRGPQGALKNRERLRLDCCARDVARPELVPAAGAGGELRPCCGASLGSGGLLLAHGARRRTGPSAFGEEGLSGVPNATPGAGPGSGSICLLGLLETGLRGQRGRRYSCPAGRCV
ncbi:hypothetical protein NDU88_004730 [Pleurodeles waltl]|uniref:Uncharacterized protein n=1 Tax=Pleurodeles waltl TaxID=8319 RepID=A0AAV7QJ41_PLEWA|nr:hypothetical protein NDU88_004730 [Pleurodeles waltl]